eukprot:scaffold825_cov249-Pinguiococcus_pyrenoidosus.AAC.42
MLRIHGLILASALLFAGFGSIRAMSARAAAAPRESFRRPLVVIGGGVAGLSVALEAASRGLQVRLRVEVTARQFLSATTSQVAVLSRDTAESASLTAAGMLAPQSERLEPGAYLDLCLRARASYPDFVAKIESLSGLETGFGARGGFFAPALQGDVNHRWTPPSEAGPAEWMDAERARTLEPLLGEDVVGGWWYPNDMQVEPRKLHRALWKACEHVGVNLVQVAAEELLPTAQSTTIDQIRLSDGRFVGCNDVVIASGSWMRELLPVPVYPIKGQMMALRPPEGDQASQKLDRVLFGDSCYVVPKTDGRIIVGATSEPEAGFDCRVTPKGLSTLFAKLGKLTPSLLEYTIEETWAGLRPSTPDFLPILGKSNDGRFYENVYYAGGYWRNGMLLPPGTASLRLHGLEARCRSDPGSARSAGRGSPERLQSGQVLPRPRGRKGSRRSDQKRRAGNRKSRSTRSGLCAGSTGGSFADGPACPSKVLDDAAPRAAALRYHARKAKAPRRRRCEQPSALAESPAGPSEEWRGSRRSKP